MKRLDNLAKDPRVTLCFNGMGVFEACLKMFLEAFQSPEDDVSTIVLFFYFLVQYLVNYNVVEGKLRK